MATATAEKKPRTRKAPATAGSSTQAKAKRTMDDNHKKAIAEGREEARAVKNYLTALEAHRPKRGRKVTVESMTARIEKINGELADGPNPLQRLLLNQEKANLETAIASFGSEGAVDLSELEAEFIKFGKRFAVKKHVSRALFRDAGVPTEVLKKAGIN